MLPIDDDEDLHLEEASDNDVTSIKDYKYKTKTPSTIALPANISTEGSVISLLVLLRNTVGADKNGTPVFFHFSAQAASNSNISEAIIM